MCIILLAEKKHLTLDILQKAENRNPHGDGIAWIDQESKKVKWIKSEKLTSEKILKIVKKYNIQFPYIVHFRITSVGSTSDQLCHPFDLSAKLDQNDLMGSSDQGVLFHNGTILEYNDIYDLVFTAGKLNDQNGIFNDIELERSDSRTISYIASNKRLGLNFLDRFFSKSQKIAVLTPKGITKFGFNWSTVKDITTSNTHGMFDFSYTSCEDNFYGNFDNSYSYTPKTNSGFSCKVKKDSLTNALNTKLTKKQRKEKKRIEKELKKCKKKLAKINEKEKNDLNTKLGHSIYCTCISCLKAKEKIIQSDKIVELQKLTKSIEQRKYESDQISDQDYYFEKLDNDQCLDILNEIDQGTLTVIEIDMVYEYLKTLTLDNYDNLFSSSMDQIEDILELAKIHKNRMIQTKFNEVNQ